MWSLLGARSFCDVGRAAIISRATRNTCPALACICPPRAQQSTASQEPIRSQAEQGLLLLQPLTHTHLSPTRPAHRAMSLQFARVGGRAVAQPLLSASGPQLNVLRTSLGAAWAPLHVREHTSGTRFCSHCASSPLARGAAHPTARPANQAHFKPFQLASLATQARQTADPREKDLKIPTNAVKAVFDKKGGPVRMVNYDPSRVKLNVGEVLVRITYSGVCHTCVSCFLHTPILILSSDTIHRAQKPHSDLHALLGDWPLPTKVETTGEPLVGGHEGAGVVVKMAEGADRHVSLGDRVGIKWVASACLNCDYCRVGHESTCTDIKNSGYHVDGTFQQYVVAPANYVTPIPDELPLQEAAPILCAGVTVYRALLEAQIGVGHWVVIPGAGGGLGHLAVQYAAAFGYRVIAIDTGADKKKLTHELGAEGWVDFKESKDIVQDVKRITGGLGAHAAVVAAASPGAYAQAMSYLRPRGSLVSVGMPADAAIQADVFDTTVSAKRIVGSIVGNRQDAIEALDLAAQGKIKVFYKTRGLSELNDVYKDMQAGTLTGRIVLDVDK